MIARSFAFAIAAVLAAGSTVLAADHSKRAGPRGPVELCCVDVALLPPIETSSAPHSRSLVGPNQAMSEAKPGLDGADWSCRRPDGSRRCFSSLRRQ